MLRPPPDWMSRLIATRDTPRRAFPMARLSWGELLAPALFALGFWRMFRPIFAEGFARSIGNGKDGLLLIATLEHWFNLATGHGLGVDWRDEGIFYPVLGSLGFTDSYFLYAVPYCALRALAQGPFAS